MARTIRETNHWNEDCYIRVSTHIAGLAAKPKDVLDTLDLTNFGVKTLLVYWILFRYN